MNPTDLVLATLPAIARHAVILLNDPHACICLAQAAAYLLAAFLLLRGYHRFAWACYVAVALSYLAEAMLAGGLPS